MISGRYKVILNPTAAMGVAGKRIPEVRTLLRGRNIDFDLIETTGRGHATELAGAAADEGYAVVVAAGGDGTANEVINGLMLSKSPPVFGILAIGRGNDFAYGAGIPSDLAVCVDLLADAEPKPLDVGRVTGGDYPAGRYFGNGIGVGFDTIVGLEAARMKRVHGFMAYVLGALKTLAIYPEAPSVTLSFNGTVIERKSHQISIMNGKRMGGTFFMAPKADDDDGLFNLCMADRMTRRQMIALMIRYTKGTQEGHPLVTTAKAPRYEIVASEGGLVVHADGETICVNGTSIVVECIPEALRILARHPDGRGA